LISFKSLLLSTFPRLLDAPWFPAFVPPEIPRAQLPTLTFGELQSQTITKTRSQHGDASAYAAAVESTGLIDTGKIEGLQQFD
jgi:hypothetical protein